MADELTYDIAPADQSVIPEEELHDSAKAVADKQNEFPVAEAVFEPAGRVTGAPTGDWSPSARPDPFPFLDEESVPSEEDKRDALVKLSPNSGLSEEEADKYATTLKKYYEAEDADSLAKKKDNLKAQYRTPEGLLQITKDPVVRQEMDMSPDDDLVAKRALNRNFLALMYDKPNASPEELDALMREHSRQHWGINNPSQETFYTKTHEDVLKSDEETKVFRSAAKAVATDVLGEELTNKRTSASERFEKIAKANPKVITAQNRDRWYQTMVLMEDRIRHLSKDARFPAATIIDLANKMTTGEPTEIDWNRGINSLRNINPNDLQQALKIASIAGRELDPEGGFVDIVVSNLAKRFGRDYTLRQMELANSKRTLSEIQEKAKAGKLQIGEDANGKPYYAMDGRPLPAWVTPVDPEKYAQHVKNLGREMEGIRIIQTLQNFQEQVRDPVTPYFKGGLLGQAEAGVYDVAGFSKLLPLYLLPPPIGHLTVTQIIGNKHFLDLTYQNPNLDIKTASRMSSLMGLAESFSLGWKASFLGANYAIFKSMRTLSGVGKSLEAFKVFAKWNLVHQTEENFEELVQDTSSEVIKKLYADANPRTMKQESWNDLIYDIASTRMQVAFAVAPLSIIGAGHATVRDLRHPMRDFMNPDALKSVGLTDEQVTEVMGAGGLEEAEKVFRKHYNTLTPEAIKSGFEYAAGLGEQAEVDAALADPLLPSLEPTILPDGTYKYNVIDADGKILSSHTDPDAAETAWVRETERVSDENAAAMKDKASQEAAQQAEAEAAARASDEGIEKEAEAKATAETVAPEDRLGTALTVDFEEHATPTQAESREVAQLQADVQAAGRSDVIILARPSNAQTTTGASTLNFVRAFEAATGKRVVFVASGTDQPLSFTGAVRRGDPNTIFLDAHGDRNMVALVGHEWSHTLEQTSPELHAEMIGRMKPLIVDWAKQEGILAQEVGPENVTNEMVANIVGDAITNENFWTVMAQKDPSLFVRVRDAVLKFFNQFVGKVQKSEFGTEAFVSDIGQMRDVVADIMQRASQGEGAAATAEGVSFAPRFVLSSQSKSHGDVPVRVDVAKVEEAFAKTGEGIGKGGEGGIAGRYERFSEFLKEGKPVEMPEVSFDWKGDVQFVNGRHRFAVLRDQGVGEIEVAVPPDQAADIQSRFGAGVSFAGRRKTEPPTQHHADIVAAHDASVAAMNGEGGGSTVNAVHGSLVGTKNFSVAVFPELSTQIPGKSVTTEQIAELAAKAKSMRIDTTGERISIGTWYDKENNTTWLDVVMTTADRERALDLAKQYNQKAIFDLENVEEITTGGTGEMVGGLPSIKDRIEAINNPTRFALAQLEQFAKDNEDFKNWYDEFSRFLDDLLKEYPEYKAIVSEFLAATSANTPLKKNVESTIENLRSFILEGKFVTKFEAHLPNLGRATRGEKLQGPKIGEFSGAVFGDVNSIAIDTHMAQIIFGARRNAKGQIIGPTDAQIRVGKEVVRQIASRLGWTPAQAQAALWAANLKLIGKYDPNYRYERYLEEHRQELFDILARDRSGEGRGREASRRIGERIREGAGTETGAGPELGGEAQPRADAAAQEAVSGGSQEVQQELGQLAPSQKEVRITVFDRQARDFVQKSMPPSRDLLNDLQRERNIYEKLLSCLS